jgi:phosphopantothenoylcysteine synthetase/decarboxylase
LLIHHLVFLFYLRADYRAAAIAEDKIKKQGDELTIKMVKNPDIVAGVGARFCRAYSSTLFVSAANPTT